MQVGDRVKLLKAVEYDKLNGLKAGFKGVVVEINARVTGNIVVGGTVKVRFDNWEEGHGPEFAEWWIAYHNLKIIP